MISILVSFRNSRQPAIDCLRSIFQTFNLLGSADIEFLFIDDHSDPEQKIPEMLAEFRSQIAPAIKVTQFLFQQHQHYTRALAYGLSAAKGRQVLFVSHDMLLTPDYVRTLLAVAASDDAIGLVRGVSPFVDAFPQHRVIPPFDLRNIDDVNAFARYVSNHWGLTHVEDRLLTGDSMLIKREVLDKIGVFDSRYFGYFGDIDFGLRLQRAGFKMVCAKGAWLWHIGAAAYKDQAATTHQDYAAVHARRMQVVNDAYKVFREKWDPSMPAEYPGVEPIPFEKLRTLPPFAADAFQPPVQPDPSICTIR